MPLLVNLRHLEAHDLRFHGQLPAAELDLDIRDEMIHANQPLEHDLGVQKVEQGLLAQGHLRLVLDCHCVRCLKPFQYELRLDPWSCYLPLEGDERVPVINDCVDLTPSVREDILLEFPPHPVCSPECGGLPKRSVGQDRETSRSGKTDAGSSAWAELNKLKF